MPHALSSVHELQFPNTVHVQVCCLLWLIVSVQTSHRLLLWYSPICHEIVSLPMALFSEFKKRCVVMTTFLFCRLFVTHIRVHTSPSWRKWMHEKHPDRQVPGVQSGATIAEVRADLFRKTLDSFYSEFPGLEKENKRPATGNCMQSGSET